MRLTDGPMASDYTFGNNGAFLLSSPEPGWSLVVIASDGMGWEHVSVRAHQGKRSRIPTWKEMAHAKDTFWTDEDLVMQLHPRKSDYINVHPHVLHLWRPIDQNIPTPPGVCV
jgi:hypothetical protein